MRKGKLDLNDLNKVIESYTGVIHKETILRPSIGEDSCVIDLNSLNQEVMFLSSDPITITSKDIGKLSIIINSNDIYASGGNCYGVILNILLSPNKSLEDFENLMRDIHSECKNHNLEILGGHTEVTDVVNDIVVCVTILGFGSKNHVVKTSSSNIGDLIFLTKPLGIEGTLILFDNFKNDLKNILSSQEIFEIENFRNKISIKQESEILKNFDITSMHDVTEGGLIGALFEMSASSRKGFKIFKNQINIHTSTQKICTYLNKDIYRLIASGNLLFTANKNLKNEIEGKFLNHGIECSAIGEVLEEGKYIFRSESDNELKFDIKDSIFD